MSSPANVRTLRPARQLLARLLALGGGLAMLAGCAVAPPGGRVRVEAGYCDPPQTYRYDPARLPLRDIRPVLDSTLTARFSRRSLLVANGAGVLPNLQRLVQLERTARRQPGTAATLAVVAERQQILAQLQLMTEAVASVAAELDCEGERADQVAAYLTNLQNRREQRLTVLSIVVGAVSGVGTTVFEQRAMQYAFGVGGGAVTAGLGFLTLFSNKKISFTHPRNLLTDIWQESPTSALYPPSVWYLLTEKAFSNSGETSVGHNTRQRWQRYGQLSAPETSTGKSEQALFFGEGGMYSAEELQIRANMLNELQSAVRLISQDLQGLILALTSGERVRW